MTEVDVLVVGYGPVGAAMAALLGRYGVRALVIDKATEIFAAPRAIALDNEALRILQQVGLDASSFERVQIPHVSFRNPQLGEFARIDTARSVDGHPMLVTFFQPELERALRERVAREPSVDVRAGVELLHFRAEDDGVRARVRTGSGAEEDVYARYLVGADGASSHVRAGLGQTFTGTSYVEDWLIVDALGVPDNIDHVEFVCDPTRPGPHMVAPGGRTRWEFMLRSGESREAMLSEQAIHELLRPWVPAGGCRIERKAVYRFHARSCSRFSQGRVFLVGDAAHITPPFVGQGLVAGLRDAANLAWKLAWVVAGRAAPSILESYDSERRPHAKKMIDLARYTGFLIMPRSAARAWLTHGAIKALRALPHVGRRLDTFEFKPSNTYRRGLFVRGRGRAQRGAWLPQGALRDELGRSILSDEALGDGLTVVCTGSGPAHETDAFRAWRARGGACVKLVPRGTSPQAGELEDVEGRFAPLFRTPWCVVVRPDRTILHDGPLSQAERVLRQSLDLLQGSSHVAAL